MKNLMILRHASPAAQGEDGTDFTRPLVDKGREEATLQGSFLRMAGIVPGVIASSTALRAATTAELLTSTLDAGMTVTQEERLYNAPGDVLLDYVRELPDSAESALIVAHMPGVAELVSMLAHDTTEGGVLFKPCMLVGIALESATHWADVVPGSGSVEWVLPPLFAR